MKKNILTLLFIFAYLQTPSSALAFNSNITRCTSQECGHWFKEYKRKSREGYADAMEVLGTFYHVGYGAQIDKDSALKWYKKSSKYFSVVGSYKAGLFYLTETDYLDIDQGIRYLKKAARKKHPQASYLLGMIFSQDTFVPHDYNEADKWLSKAFITPNKRVKNYADFLKSENLLTNENFPQLTELSRQYEKPVLISNTKNDVQTEVNEATSNTNLVANSDNKNNFNNNPSINAETEFPEDEMEVIEVSPLTMVELFEADFAFFETFMAEKRDRQARKGLYRRPCEKTISCSVTSNADFSRMVDLLDSGALSGR